MRLSLHLASAEDTARLGAALARRCAWDEAPRLLYLRGELGAGKTTLASALLAGLGLEEPARSPSYALLEVYPLHQGVALHLDCYRINDPRELEQLGLRDHFRARTLWLIEWPERGRSVLPPPDLSIALEPQETGRRALLEAHSPAGEHWLAQLPGELTSEPKLD